MTERTGKLIQWSLVVPLVGFAGYALYDGIGADASRSERLLASGPVTQRSLVNSKIRREGDKQYLWARGPKVPEDDASEWFDMTGSPIELESVNHGIGKDRIASIDEPVFVPPDDPRLRRKWGGSDDADIRDLRVICYAHNDEAKAYPVRLLDRRELVNDEVGGKPVTVGW